MIFVGVTILYFDFSMRNVLYQVGALAYAIAFQTPSFWGYMWAVIYAIIVDWLLVGVAIASTCTYLANKYLRQHHSHSVEQEVEWMFAWDVHANGYICSFFLTHVLQVEHLPRADHTPHFLPLSYMQCVCMYIYAIGVLCCVLCGSTSSCLCCSTQG
jgi:hypothetical protein